MNEELDEARQKLQELAQLATAVEPEHLTLQVEEQLKKLSEAREKLYTEPVEELKPAPPVKVKVREPQKFEMPRVPASSRKLPTSFHAERYVPYRVLWAKVIIRAAYDYALWRESKDMRLRKFAQDAERWLFEPSTLELGFESICFHFDFPIEQIRKKTRTLTKNDVKKLEFRERHGRAELFSEDNVNGSDE